MSLASERHTAPVQRKAQFSVTWADLGMLFTAFIWGANFTVVKQALTEVSPLAFVALRFLIAALCLLAILLLSGENLRVAREDVAAIILLSLIGHVGYQALFITGIALTTASNSSLLLSTTPLFVALLSIALRTERITPAIGAGIFLSFAGIALIVGMGSGDLSANIDTLPGNLLTLGAAICWTLNTLISKPLLNRYSPLKLTTVTIMIATPCLFVLGSADLLHQQWAGVSAHGWLGVIFSALFANGVAYVLWNLSVQKTGSTRTAVFSNLVPVIAITVSWLYLGETLGVWQALGAIVTLTGVTLTRFRPRRPITGPQTQAI
jgi:drug/metabolite transporter (DMT)-like permease